MNAVNEKQINSNPISFRDEENNVEEIDNNNSNKFVLNNTQNVFTQNLNDNLIYEPGLKNNFGSTVINQNLNTTANLKEKLQELDRKIKEDLEKNPNFIRVLIYENFQNNYKLYQGEIEKDLQSLDPKGEKFISEESFLEFCENYVILDDYEKNILLMDVVRNSSNGKYSYEDFLEKVNKSNCICRLKEMSLGKNK